jgi:hypothetical protein
MAITTTSFVRQRLDIIALFEDTDNAIPDGRRSSKDDVDLTSDEYQNSQRMEITAL